MKSNLIFNSDTNSATVYIMKVLQTDSPNVWEHFTNSKILDLWWAPKPWKTQTLSMNFKPNGSWKFLMNGLQGEKQFSSLQYHEINTHRSFDFTEVYTDEGGNVNTKIPASNWLVGFTGVEEGTKLTINIHFNNEEEMKTIMEMGFEERVLTSLDQLETLLNKKD